MSTVIGLLDCAISNLEEPNYISIAMSRALIKQYKQLKEAGANDDDDADEALEKYPHCNLDASKIFQ